MKCLLIDSNWFSTQRLLTTNAEITWSKRLFSRNIRKNFSNSNENEQKFVNTLITWDPLRIHTSICYRMIKKMRRKKIVGTWVALKAIETIRIMKLVGLCYKMSLSLDWRARLRLITNCVLFCLNWLVSIKCVKMLKLMQVSEVRIIVKHIIVTCANHWGL